MPFSDEQEAAAQAPTMRSYPWGLSGDFSAKIYFFGEPKTEEDLDALRVYVELTIKALKRSMKRAHNEVIRG